MFEGFSFAEKIALTLAGALVFGSFFVFPSVFAIGVNPGDVIINEFVSNGDEWVELLNMSDSDISLSGFKLSELTTPQAPQGDILFPTEILLLELSGTIPAHGILVFDIPGSKLNNEGDSIALYNGVIDLSNLWQRVTYGSVNENYPVTAGLAVAPASGFSDAYLDGAWQTGQTPSKGWFNDAGREDTAPLLGNNPNSIDSLLANDGIDSNIGELDNPSATLATEENGALYFEKEGEGKIVFEQTLNLTNQATVAILQDLGEAMDMSEGFVSFDSETADKMAATGAKIYMYNLGDLGFTSEPDLIVKDDDGNVIDPENEDYPAIESEYNSDEGTLMFTTDHFTQFEVEKGIFGTKWNDLDGNGIRDWNDDNGNDEKDEDEEYTEPGISDWTIVLFDGEGGEIITTTDVDGNYFFTDLENSEYFVCEVRKSGDWIQTYPNDDTSGGGSYSIYSECDAEDSSYARHGYAEIEIGDVVNVSNLDFGNREIAHITVRKETYPDESDQQFDFNIVNAELDLELDEFPLSDGEKKTLDVVAGTYTITETVPNEEWRLVHIACEYDGDSVGESAPPSGETVTLDAGDTVTCTFTNINRDITIITGYKWEDLDGDGKKDEGEPGRKNWNIALGRAGDPVPDHGGPETIPIEIVALSLTGSDGWYYLPVTESGQYKVFEEKRDGWATTNPAAVDSFFDIEYQIEFVQNSFFDIFVDLYEQITDPDEELILQDGQTITEVDGHPLDFGNFELVDITGFKWDDKNGDGVWQKSCDSEGCVAEPGLQDIIVALGRQNGDPIQKDGHETIPIEIIAMDLTGGRGDFVFPNVGPGRYKLFEEKKSGWSATNPAARADSFFDITYDLKAIAIGDPDFDLLRVTGDPDFDLLRDSFFDVFVEVSGQIVNQSEMVQTTVTGTIPAMPLEFGNHKLLVINKEEVRATEVQETSTVISWITDFPGTSRVVYDTVSHPVLGSAPNYGYANSTAVFDESPKVTNHSVSISGLTAGTTYYYRTISAASPESVGSEGSFGTPAPSSSGGGGGGSSGGGGGGGGIVILPGTSQPETNQAPQQQQGGEPAGEVFAAVTSSDGALFGGSVVPSGNESPAVSQESGVPTETESVEGVPGEIAIPVESSYVSEASAESGSFLAAAIGALSFGTQSPLLALVTVLAVLASLAYGGYWMNQKKFLRKR